jgi:hypothetical protein
MTPTAAAADHSTQTTNASEWDWPAVGDPAAGRLPDFVVIGSMKAGTTTLFEYLCRHPKLFMCSPKEPQFFSRRHVWDRGFAWYHAQFSPARPDQLCGEASTCYSRWPNFAGVATRLHRYLPDAKLIYQLRHPVDRAYSHYAHLMQERTIDPAKGPVMGFDEALDAIPEIIESSLYLMQIQQYLPYYPKEQWLLMTLEGYQADPRRELDRLQAFLGLQVHDLMSAGPIRANRAGDKLQAHRWEDMLGRFRRFPGIAQVVALFPASLRPKLRAWARQLPVREWFTRGDREAYQRLITPMTPQTRARLLERFRQPNRELAAYAGMDFAAWER